MKTETRKSTGPSETEIEEAFRDWMSALSDYNHAQETTRDERAIQRAYDAMKAARTKYRTLKNLKA